MDTITPSYRQRVMQKPCSCKYPIKITFMTSLVLLKHLWRPTFNDQEITFRITRLNIQPHPPNILQPSHHCIIETGKWGSHIRNSGDLIQHAVMAGHYITFSRRPHFKTGAPDFKKNSTINRLTFLPGNYPLTSHYH